MMGNNPDDYASFSVNPLELEAALQKAGREARRRHALEGRSVPILEDGKIVWLTPEMILAAEAAENEKGQQDTSR
jgi:hypothetical protein